MIYEAQKNEKLTFRVEPPLFLPFYNEWGKNVYYRSDRFSLDPFKLDATSTSGSPVVLSGCGFFGFLNDVGGTFAFDGSRYLTVSLSEGARLYYNEYCNPYEEWRKYSETFMTGNNEKCDFWSNLEYCTWVEQAKQSSLAGKTHHEVMNEGFIYDYLERAEKLSLPKGKFTIDDGWADGSIHNGDYQIGNWEPDKKKFPSFEKTVADIKSAGYIPGLWLAPFTLTKNSRLAKEHPELIGKPFNANLKWHNILPVNDELLTDYYREIFGYYISIGIKKFKLDISYGPKNDMIRILKLIHSVIKEIAPDTEVETHIPDIFATRYADTVRINDVSFDNAGNWRRVVSGHYTVCRNSSPDKILNLDHIGTNAYLSSALNYLEHLDILTDYSKESGGYPVISYLPDLFTEDVRQKTREKLSALYDENGKRKNI